MKIRNIWLACFFTFSIQAVLAQNVELNGLAEAFGGKKITLFSRSDFLSGKMEKIGSTIVADDGKFNFSFDTDSVKMYLLKTSGISGSFYMEPQKKYNVIFPDLPKDAPRTINSTNTVDILFPNLDSLDINFILSDFNLHYENYFYRNIRLLESKIYLSIIDSFKVHIKRRYAHVNNYFFKTYANYAIGSAELLKYDAGGGRKKLEIFNDYLRNKPILYTNNEYIRFVNGFFKDYIYSYNHTKKTSKIFYAINEAKSPTLLMEIYKSDDFLRDKELREFIVIQSVSAVFGKKGFENDGVLAILDSISQKSIFRNNSLLAKNMISEMTKLSIGYPAPDFSFMDKKDRLMSLSDYQGRYVYLNFWASWCKECITQLKILPELYKKYKKDIEIISICVDEDPKEMDYVLEKNKNFKWNFMHSPIYSEVFEAYNVRSVPSYYLIDDQGNILQYPALAPSPSGTDKTIEETFNSIYRKRHPNRRGWK